MNNVSSFINKRQTEQDYIEIIQSLKFGLHNEMVITEKGNIQNIWFIALKDRETDVTLQLTPYTKLIRYSDKTIDQRRSETIKDWGQFVCRFLNFVLIDNYSKFKIDEIKKVSIEAGNKFLEEYAKGNVGGKEKSMQTLQKEMNKLCKLYSYIKSIYKKDATKIHKLKWKYRDAKNRVRYNNHFSLNDNDNERLKFDIFRNMPSEIFEVFLRLSEIHYPELTFAIALQAYAGLRPGEICNVRQSIAPKTPGVTYQKIGSKISAFNINLTKKLPMRADGTNVGGIKKRRTQKVYTPYLTKLQGLYKKHLSILNDCKFDSGYYPMFVNNNGEAITVKSYRDKIERLANVHLKEFLAKSNNVYFRRYAEILTQKKLSPHFLRHYFTVLLVLDGLTPHEIASWRGDKSLDTSLIYCRDKDDLLRNIKELNGDIVEDILTGADDS
ncbi:site-specific integrase [Clostridium perfringens]|uniref:site-specific integrase n=1 Tax=Clostridium perfringens TaxID=1502 RepID=UPI0013E35E92|nr:site-specific integrase [Clostridium perfringens]NGT94377.1 site-specific integrase [Clostridium perfringens]